MANTASEPQLGQILDRRKQLKRQRRLRFVRATWRTTAIMGLTAALSWVLIRSEWTIQKPSQVAIQGNQQIATQTLSQLLPLSYPTSLIQIRPQTIVQALQTRGHIQQVSVTRQLFPAQLTVMVQERAPVAVTECDRCQLLPPPTAPDQAVLGPTKLWLIDEQGIALPLETYGALQKSGELPQLSLSNFLQPPPQTTNTSPSDQPSPGPNKGKPVVVDPQKQAQWQQMYPMLQQSSVEISAVNWQPSQQLILSTELGQVHLGPYGSRMGDQLQALDQLRSLPNAVDTNKVAYIDLRDPQRPVLEMRELPPKPSPTSTRN